MKIVSLSLIAVALAAAPGESRAGGYVSAGIGTAPAIGGELSFLEASGSRSGRVALGHGFGPVSLEASLGGYGVQGAMPQGDFVDGTAMSAGASVRGHVPLLATFSAFARLGLERTWVTGEMNDLSGNGYIMGAGLELGLPMILADTALWLEGDREVMTLTRSVAASYGGHADSVLLGLRVGI